MHFYENPSPLGDVAGNKTAQLIVEAWLVYLMKARTVLSVDRSSVEQLSPQELGPNEAAIYARRQTELNDLGVTRLLVDIVSSDGVADLPEVAIDCLVEMLNGGNRKVAATVYNYLLESDGDGKFLRHIDALLDSDLDHIITAKARRGFATGSPLEDDVAASCESIMSITRLMQLLCEGHFLRFQELMRVQPMNTGNVDLVERVSCRGS